MSRYSQPPREDNWTFVRCTIERETQKAILIVDGRNDEHWVPKSQIRRVGGGLEIKGWLIEKNDIYVDGHGVRESGEGYRQSGSDSRDAGTNDWSPIEEPGDDRFAPPAPDQRERDYGTCGNYPDDDIPF